METFSALLALCAGNSPVAGEFPAHKGQWSGALMSSLICASINGWVNNRGAGDFRRYRAHHDVTVMQYPTTITYWLWGIAMTQLMHDNKQYEDKMLDYHYNDVTMSAMASQITSLKIVYSTVYLGAGQRKRQSSASLAFVREFDQWIPAQRYSNAKNVSMWWRHHDTDRSE